MIPLFKVHMAPTVSEQLQPILHSGYITQGAQVSKFEEALAAWFDNYGGILTVNSATSGLTLALRLCDLPSGSEVLSCPLTCMATNTPILNNNLRIRWVDVDPETCNMDLNDLEGKITADTRVVVVVHWGGNPVDLHALDTILEVAEKKYGHRIQVIEDCAHAFGSMYDLEYVGTFPGHICVFSLQAIKQLTSGDGGLIFLPTKKLYERAKLLRWFGIDRDKRSLKSTDFRMETDVAEWGYKFHMNDINATIGLANLPFVRDHLAHSRRLGIYYQKELSRVNGVRLFRIANDATPSWWIFPIKIVNRDGFIQFMAEHQVVVSQVHRRNDTHSCMRDFVTKLPHLDKLETELVNIPVGWWVTQTNAEFIVRCIKEWCEIAMANPRIEELQTVDIPLYLDLLLHLNNYKIALSIDDMRDRYIRIKKNGGRIFCIWVGTDMVGTGKLMIECKFGDSVCHIEDVCIHPDDRGEGLGTMMVNHLITCARADGCYKAVLYAKDWLKAFYEGSCNMEDHGTNFTIRF